jgi:hypothetical protein
MFIHGVTALLITSHPGAGFPWLPRERLVDTAVDLIVKACNPAPPSRA